MVELTPENFVSEKTTAAYGDYLVVCAEHGLPVFEKCRDFENIIRLLLWESLNTSLAVMCWNGVIIRVSKNCASRDADIFVFKGEV